MNENILIFPSIAIGCSEHHSEFAGSLSLQHIHFYNQLHDIANCVVKYGFQNILALNSHGGNQAIGQAFVESFGYLNSSVQVVHITWWRIVLEQLKSLNKSVEGGTGHAGEFETSLMQLIAAELVDIHQIESKANVPTYTWAEGDMLQGHSASLYRTMKEMTPTGVYGDPSYATKEKGEAISKLVIEALKVILSDIQQ